MASGPCLIYLGAYETDLAVVRSTWSATLVETGVADQAWVQAGESTQGNLNGLQLMAVPGAPDLAHARTGAARDV
ncbi:hypothetical protein [Kineosporia babensis]|uniref:Uncharacterized protein n=1 Tax=Kineosporia babensis TaxID=499548 RepID=A0A9X1NPK1_9ACTN|nr:hypothetical protein [Kineosporia babensis]MCD5316926.1 hypothetical protein [Kineosporia babensis]